MKRIYYILMCVFALFLSAKASAQQLQFETNTDVQQGQTVTLNVMMNSCEAVRGFQFDLTLPEGLIPIVSKVGDTSHDLIVSKVGESKWRVLSYSMDNAEYSADFGAVVNISISVPEYLAVGSYTIYVSNAYLSAHDNSKIEVEDFCTTLTVTPDSYTITYFVDGEVYYTETMKIGAVITPIAEPEKEGHTFSGWSEMPVTMPAHDITVTGTFTVNKYMVRYYEGETLLAEYEVEFGAEIPQYEYNNDEFIFQGWDGEVYDIMPAHDIAYYAITTPNGIADIKIDDNAEITVYDMTGLTVYKGKKAGASKQLKGMYIVKYDDKTVKCRL